MQRRQDEEGHRGRQKKILHVQKQSSGEGTDLEARQSIAGEEVGRGLYGLQKSLNFLFLVGYEKMCQRILRLGMI